MRSYKLAALVHSKLSIMSATAVHSAGTVMPLPRFIPVHSLARYRFPKLTFVSSLSSGEPPPAHYLPADSILCLSRLRVWLVSPNSPAALVELTSHYP